MNRQKLSNLIFFMVLSFVFNTAYSLEPYQVLKHDVFVVEAPPTGEEYENWQVGLYKHKECGNGFGDFASNASCALKSVGQGNEGYGLIRYLEPGDEFLINYDHTRYDKDSYIYFNRAEWFSVTTAAGETGYIRFGEFLLMYHSLFDQEFETNPAYRRIGSLNGYFKQLEIENPGLDDVDWDKVRVILNDSKQ